MGVDLSKAGLETVGASLYEGLFLVDSAEASADWDAVVTAVRNVLERVEAEIVSIRKWDERRLAYKINGKVKGTYILCYFRVAGSKIQEIERNIQLSTTIWRALILNAEQQTEKDIEKDTPVTLVEKQQQKPQLDEQSIDSEEAKGTEAKQPVSGKQAEQAQGSEHQPAEPEPAKDASEDRQEQKQVRADENVEQDENVELKD